MVAITNGSFWITWILRENGHYDKTATTRLNYQAKDGKEYIFNSRYSRPCTLLTKLKPGGLRRAALVVDYPGRGGQTWPNYLALMKILRFSVINKIDLASADPDAAKAETFLESMLQRR